MNLVLLGPPGAGKGTQAKVLSNEFKLLHISTGDMLRNAVQQGTEVGRLAKRYMDSGALVPDNVVIDIVRERISQPDAKFGFMLDGFPRNEAQATRLDEALAKAGKKLDVVLFFKTSPDVSVTRLSGRRVCDKCGANFHIRNMPPKKTGVCDHCGGRLVQREDDREETIKKRLAVYETETKSLIDYYKKKKILNEVDGDLEVKELFKKIKTLFEKHTLT